MPMAHAYKQSEESSSHPRRDDVLFSEMEDGLVLARSVSLERFAFPANASLPPGFFVSLHLHQQSKTRNS
jgi:hypothetical protein